MPDSVSAFSKAWSGHSAKASPNVNGDGVRCAPLALGEVPGEPAVQANPDRFCAELPRHTLDYLNTKCLSLTVQR
jgi:hypothetical protein